LWQIIKDVSGTLSQSSNLSDSISTFSSNLECVPLTWFLRIESNTLKVIKINKDFVMFSERPLLTLHYYTNRTMKTLANLLTSIIVATWVMGIAILSVQNAEPVSLRFLNFRSVQIPVGLVLAFCAVVGIIGMALLQPLWGLTSYGQSNSDEEDDAEFFTDENY
jgi:uncharacterized integral membrane protein